MATDPALLALATRAADAADDARDAAQDVALQLRQLDARVVAIEAAARVGPSEGLASAKGGVLAARTVDAVVAKPLLLVYFGIAVGVGVALALSGSAVVNMAQLLVGGSHAQ